MPKFLKILGTWVDLTPGNNKISEKLALRNNNEPVTKR